MFNTKLVCLLLVLSLLSQPLQVGFYASEINSEFDDYIEEVSTESEFGLEENQIENTQIVKLKVVKLKLSQLLNHK